MPEFLFATCLPGFEAPLKREVARTRPGLRFAYSRPGLVTFKAEESVSPADRPGAALARVWGKSLGKAEDAKAAEKLLVEAGAQKVHVYARDPEAGLDLSGWTFSLPTGTARDGELVGDVIVAEGEPSWVGIHRHDSDRSPHPGGSFPVTVPAESPSRAYAKIEEAILWQKLPVKAGQTAVEIGAAPGGAVMALAKRGLKVYGVDTGELAPQVKALPGVHHIAKSVGALRWEDLPEKVEWLLLDVNLAPQVALHEVSRFIPPFKRTLQGAVFTLKMNDWAFLEELPQLEKRILAMGFSEVKLRHLPSNRREICAVATR